MTRRPFSAHQVFQGTLARSQGSASRKPRCSSATTAVRRIWRRLLACRAWCCSARRIRPSGDRGGRNRRSWWRPDGLQQGERFASHRRARTAADARRGARLNDLYRLLRYARPYIPALLLSVLFMAVVGASQGLLLQLIRVVFDRVFEARHVRCAGAAVLDPLDQYQHLSR